MNSKPWEEILNNTLWKNAVSYQNTFPHTYTTRKLFNNDKLFEDFIRIIRIYGKAKSFYKKQYIYLEIGDYEYWEMGRPIKAVQVLNKALIDDNKEYRFPAPTEDEETLLKMKLNDREIYFAGLLNKENKTDKDKRQIDFLMNSERRIYGGGKNIIDHSNINVRYE